MLMPLYNGHTRWTEERVENHPGNIHLPDDHLAQWRPRNRRRKAHIDGRRPVTAVTLAKNPPKRTEYANHCEQHQDVRSM